METYNRGGMVEDKHSGFMWAVVVAVVTKVLSIVGIFSFFSQQRQLSVNFPRRAVQKQKMESQLNKFNHPHPL